MSWLAVFMIATISLVSSGTTNPIETAQAKALEHKRQEACAILIQAIEANKSQAKMKAKLTESLSAISSAFFTDKGQKLFELAQSAMLESPESAISQLKEALVLEDKNLQISLALVRAYLNKKDFTEASLALGVSKSIQPYSQDVFVLGLRLMAAQGRFEELRESVKTAPTLERAQDIFVKQMVAQDFAEQNMSEKAFEVYNKMTELDGKYPETYYFLAKTGAILEKNSEDWSRKYVSLCKNVDARTRRKYANEPALCSRVKEVEDELSKKTSE